MNARNFAKWAACLALVGMGGSAYGLPLQIEWIDGPQDPMFLPHDVHELGTNQFGAGAIPFPLDEEIFTLNLGPIQQTACSAGPFQDDPGIPNFLIQMTNLSPHTWYDVHYVRDEFTFFTNFDGFIGNLGLGDAMEAFRIDSVGVNRPLIAEVGGIAGDNIFQPGETWEFIIQDYTNGLGGPPHHFDSPGITSASPGWPPSTGSIIAVIPEPAVLGLMVLGLGGLVVRRRR